MESKFQFKDKVVDTLTGFTGFVTGIFFRLAGDVRYEVTTLRSDGGISELWIDEIRLERVG